MSRIKYINYNYLISMIGLGSFCNSSFTFFTLNFLRVFLFWTFHGDFQFQCTLQRTARYLFTKVAVTERKTTDLKYNTSPFNVLVQN